MTQKNSALALMVSACIKEARAVLLALQPAGPDLLILMMLEASRWTA